jgi:hypothetical protein
MSRSSLLQQQHLDIFASTSAFPFDKDIMSSSQLLDRFQCQHVPELVWRVNDTTCQARYNSTEDLIAKSDSIPKTIEELKSEVQKHLIWTSRHTSPFLSVFSDKTHSSRWAIHQQKKLERTHGRHNLGMKQLEIDARRLTKYTWIFHVEDLVKCLEIPTGDRTIDSDEYLVFNYIPRIAIIWELNLTELEAKGQYSYPRLEL